MLRWGVPEKRPDYGEFAAPQWTRTQLCRLLRDFFWHRGATAPDAGSGSGPVPPAGLVRVGTDLTFQYDAHDRLARVTPDIYVLPAAASLSTVEQLRTYKVWERGMAPTLCVHLTETPISPEDGLMMHFFRLGVQDVVLYDPLWFLQASTPGALKGRALLRHYRRKASGDGMQLQPLAHPGRVPLLQHGLWLVHRGGAELRVYAHASGSVHGADIPPESACWLLPEERA